MADELQIIDIRHPEYLEKDYEKWRLTYKGGQDFINKYLKKYSSRETNDDFEIRKTMSYLPAFAKEAVNDIKNAIFQRTVDVIRKNGSPTYQKAIDGLIGGVDLNSSSMNEFVGNEILPELLPMAKVGVYVDNVSNPGDTLKDAINKHPYLYIYKIEDILSQSYVRQEGNIKLKTLLLRDRQYVEDSYGLPYEEVEKYRYLRLTEKGVEVRFFDDTGAETENYLLNLKSIPFVFFNIIESIIADVCNHQVALLNLSSSDLNTIKNNFPFYTEQYDPKTVLAQRLQQTTDADGNPVEVKKEEIVTGAQTGRKYPVGTERPQFINPSAEPLRISMEKQNDIKKEIRALVSLAVSNLRDVNASAESKGFDERGLEAGLSYIGLVLERGERQIMELWAMYEKASLEGETLKYPEKYSLQSDSEKLGNAKSLKELMSIIPSQTYRKECAKEIARITIGSKISYERLEAIDSEINKAEIIVVDNEQLIDDVEAGLVSTQSASGARGYPEGEYKKAQEEKKERIAAVAIAQTKGMGALANPDARGLKDMDNGASDGSPISGAEGEKENNKENDNGK